MTATQEATARPRWVINAWQLGILASGIIGFSGVGLSLRPLWWDVGGPGFLIAGMVGAIGLAAFVACVYFSIKDFRRPSRRTGAVEVLVWGGLGLVAGLFSAAFLATFGDVAA